jgi:hypothetical protein
MPRTCISTIAPRVALLGVLLFASLARGAEPAPTPEAAAHFKAGVAHLDAERYAEAYREFKEAYAITPRWTVLGNMGLAAENLERDGEAIDVLEQYLKRGGSQISTTRASKFRSTIQRLEKGVASVTLEAPGTFWIVDTRIDAESPVVNEYGPFSDRVELRVRAGQHEFKLDRSSITAPTWSATLRAGAAETHAFEVATQPAIVETFASEVPEQSEPGTDIAPPSRTVSYVLWGTGAGAAIATTVLLLESKSIQDEANDHFAETCPFGATNSGPCAQTLDQDRKAAHWRTAALVTGIGAVGALATGTVLYFLHSSGSDEREPAEQATMTPWVSPTGIGLSGAF